MMTDKQAHHVGGRGCTGHSTKAIAAKYNSTRTLVRRWRNRYCERRQWCPRIERDVRLVLSRGRIVRRALVVHGKYGEAGGAG